MTTPYDPAQNQPPANQQPMPPTAQFPQVPAGQYPPPAGQFPAQPGQTSPPPGGWHNVAPAPAARKRPAWLVPTLIGVGAMVALCCGIGSVSAMFGDSKPASVSASEPPAVAKPADATTTAPATTTPATTAAAPAPAKTTAAPAPAKPKTFGIGDKVRGGDFEFTVKSVKCGISQVGTQFLNTKAQGAFCKVSVTVKNVTKSAHTFHADGTLTAQDASGRKYEADGEAGIYGNSDGQGFLDEINPGNSVTANVYFDVPKGTKLKTITFDAGLFTLAEDAVVTL
ncbi:DUF4352 domain-containing protein [Micromonospora sp. U21]|uniref:DUF4352 domain-containing protein n=1 Tax=Micromonospora sp. U21 TaxID=2824899 RepID=UPI001B38A935|nr:DUF4352 domain-containing protein [Micromonospora sp. U21]MBQ0906026.1 DUF4352 domain-containing protein [Micromonospora sp. U21]